MNTSNYLDISKVFSPVLLDNLAYLKFDKVSKIIKNAKIEYEQSEILNLRDLLNNTYKDFTINYRNEHFYKNTLFNSLILKNHNLENCITLTEFSVGNSFVDVAVFNGTSTAYEIKSEKDSAKRLFQQVSDYVKTFEYVYLVSYDDFIEKIKNDLPENIGILSLDKKTNAFKSIRKATSNFATFDHKYFFDSLRISEIKNIINIQYSFVPDVPNTLIYKECFNLFRRINLDTLQILYLAEIRKREMSEFQKELIRRMPESIKITAISKRYSREQCENIIQHLDILF